jgi:predicted naringenin-chalcone synthase
LAAAHRALAASDVASTDVTHLITVSCTGFSAPGVDVALIKGLSLAPTIGRTHVGFMGCHGALNGMRVAQALVRADTTARVLLCAVELCSLHYQYGMDPQAVVANALFADGAAALVVGGPAEGKGERWRIAACGSLLIPDTEGDMSWRIGDHGFRMTLSACVPDQILRHLRPWLEQWLASQGFPLRTIEAWAIHPGGPRILSSVIGALGLPADAAEASAEVLAECGNMSSPTVLFVLQQLQQSVGVRPCVALAFGPGLTAEAVLLVESPG